MNWVSVEDRFPTEKPSKRKNFLCFDGHTQFVTCWREYQDGPGFEIICGEPTHWMPLPEPPKVYNDD